MHDVGAAGNDAPEMCMSELTAAAAEADMEGLIDAARLSEWMDRNGLPGPGEPLEARLISLGASNVIVDIQRGEHRMVLRRPPRKVPPGRNESMLREYRVLEALNGTDVPHPEALGACDDESVMGSTFYVMGHVDGWSPMSYGRVWPAPFDSDMEARGGLATQLVDGIARLSRIDWRARGLEGFGHPEGFHERQADRWLKHLSGFKFRELPGIDEAAGWLRTHKPSRYVPGILHGDYQFANVMYRDGAPAQLAAIVDWEMATVGDPLLDLGWVLMQWPNEDEDRSSSGYVDYRGMPSRQEMAAYYTEVSGRPTDELDYYIILARYKIAIVLEGGYARVVKGDADNPKMRAFGDIVLDMARKAAELARTTPLR
jgi:aminoglycoside phosphotransferase (APT) family kinase protein